MPRQLAQQRMTVSDPEWEVASLAISAVVEVVVWPAVTSACQMRSRQQRVLWLWQSEQMSVKVGDRQSRCSDVNEVFSHKDQDKDKD